MEQPLSPKIRELLQDVRAKEPYLRKTAVEELGKLRNADERILSTLRVVMTSDENKYVKSAAQEAYFTLTGQRVEQETSEQLSEQAVDRKVEQHHVTLLERIRHNTKLIAAIVGIVIGLWLLVIFLQPEINTSAGKLLITKVRFADSVPPGCTSPSYTCIMAEPGYRILIVRMKSGSGENIETLSNGISREVYVASDNGSQTKWFQQQMNISPPWVFLAFAVKDSERNFKMVWPNNPPIALNPILYFIP